MPDHDVIVIGAGFTGLTAAVALMEAGCDVVLVEARQRVGGRAEAEYLPDGTRIDTGGQFFCRDMTHLVDLAKQHGAEEVWTYVSGRPSYRPPLAEQRGESIWQEVDRLRDRMIALDLSDPALAGLTVAQWIERQQDEDPAVLDSFRRLVMGLWCRAPEEISLAYLASNDRRITNVYPELEMFLAGTMQGLAEKLAARLGDRLRLSSPATCVTLMDDEVEVDVNGRAITARQVIFAVPPVMARQIEISPALPARLTKALDAWSPGCVIKLMIGYETPFWRDRGLSGSVRWSTPQGMYACDISHGNYYGLVVFIGGPLASDWHKRLQSELVAFVTDELASALGEEARTPRSTCVRDWVNDAWSDGAYSDVITDLHSPDAEDVLLEGLPRLRFACSELSPSFPGYIEGAIVAGNEAAQTVLWKLGK
ncbi:monoamine oxidase [Rhizobium sp. NFR07]|uniref:flavin monoamine oxidase family protein n=1 Tax=Rhizobium sp. NFR07 TaxID=1566262 RepID=UPI0008F24754|nr:FAD-dependent oxidoreductase [Rhizobium sp. NFR07]SFB64193.1 monoamine oxidase [Rhizobium sp. NFR07]